jgi:hypothetical protein
MLRLALASALVSTACTAGLAFPVELDDFAVLCPIVRAEDDFERVLAERGYTEFFNQEWSKTAKAMAVTTKDATRVLTAKYLEYVDATYLECSVGLIEDVSTDDLVMLRKKLEAGPIGPMLGESYLFDGQGYHVHLKSLGRDPVVSLEGGVNADGALFTLTKWDFK